MPWCKNGVEIWGVFFVMEWKSIGNTGYQISDSGKVKNKHGKILRPCFRKGYEYVTICGIRYSIHRLVALAFIPNPDGKPEIDHINAIRTDNRAENLRWVTRKENAHNPLTMREYKKMTHIYSALDKRRKPIYQMAGGMIVAEFDCIRDAERATGISHQNIASVLCGRSRVAGGFGWKYK